MLDWKTVVGVLGWIIAGLLALISALLAFMGRDALKRITHLEQTTVSKADLYDLKKDLTQQNKGMHGENSKRLDNIQGGIRETHARIDDLYRDLINNRN